MEQWKNVTAILTIAALYLIMEVAFGITCPILYLTGISCAGCGMSRAWFCLLQLNLAGAFRYHPLFWIPLIAAGLFPVWHKVPRKMKKILLITACILFLGVYTWRMLDTTDSIVVFRPESGVLVSMISALLTER